MPTPSQAAATVVTVTYNSARDLSLREPHTDPEIEWIVVDNASTDDSIDLAQRLGASVIAHDRNVGFSAANNIGARKATGDVLIFCNPDVHFDADGVRRLARRAREEKAVVAPQLLNSDGTMQENGRGVPFPHRKLRHFVSKGSEDVDPYLYFAGPDEVREVVWVIGAAVAIHTDEFERLGGWNERYFIYYEDSDFCLRARQRGMRVLLDGSVRWVHGWTRATRGGFNWRAWRSEFRSAVVFYLSHLDCIVPWGRGARALMQVERSSVSASGRGRGR
jgi:N-acetylglucosaminyl-diphospho-decaprenol L-rhamnosyltransferase